MSIVKYGRYAPLRRPPRRPPTRPDQLGDAPIAPSISGKMPFWTAKAWDYFKPTAPAGQRTEIPLDRTFNRITMWIFGGTNGGWERASDTFPEFYLTLSNEGGDSFKVPISFNAWFTPTTISTGINPPASATLGGRTTIWRFNLPSTWTPSAVMWSFSPKWNAKSTYLATEESSQSAAPGHGMAMQFYAKGGFKFSGSTPVIRTTLLPFVLNCPGVGVNKIIVNSTRSM